MKAFSLARQAIFLQFEAARAASTDYPTEAEFPIEAANRRFKRPDSGPWGRLVLTFGERNPIAVGGNAGKQNLNRTAFVLGLQIFLPEHTGEKEAYEIAGQIMGALDYETTSILDFPITTRVDCFFETSSFIAVGKVTGGESGPAGTEQFNATISGHFDDVLTDVP